MFSIASLAALASGGVVGFSLGLIGSGGSILATPLLIYAVGVSSPYIAICTGALAVSVNAFSSLLGHAFAGNVRWRSASIFAVVGTLGALVGSSLGKLVDGQRLLFLFGIAMLVVGAHMLRRRKIDGQLESESNVMACGAAALFVGIAAGFFGIGGGFLIVPSLMMVTRMPMIKAVGTSLLAVGSFGLATAINYALSGMVDWSIAAKFVIGGLIGGLAGMALANRLSPEKDTLKRILAAVILMVATYVLYRSSRAMLT